MIVKCDKCQTRFKIPDDKVTPKGVKVRCTKCSNTFRVYRSATDPTQATTTPPDAAPEQDPFAQFAPSPAAPPAQSTKPGYFSEGVEATKNATPGDMSAMFAEPTNVKPAPAPPSRPKPAAAGPASLKAGEDLSSLLGQPTVVTQAPAPPKPKPAPGPASLKAGDDLSDLLGQPTRVGPKPARSSKPLAGAAAERVDGADFSDLLGGGPATAAAAANLKSLPPAKGDPKPLKAPPKSSAPLDLDIPGLAEAPPGPTQPEGSGARKELFGGGGDGYLTSSGSHGVSPAPAGPDRGLFDIPPPEPARPSAGADPFGPPPPQALETAGDAAPPSTVHKPAGKPEDARGLEETVARRPGAARRLSGVVVNIAVSTALLLVLLAVGGVYLNEGKLDPSAISMARIREVLVPPRRMVAVDVSNGLYETRHGRPVFYVRGEIANRGDSTAKVKVRAEILDGEQLVRAAEGYAGTVPSPEELHAIGSAEDVEAMAQRLAAGAQQLAPGARAPFLLAFHEYPPELSRFRLRVVVVEEGGPTAAR